MKLALVLIVASGALFGETAAKSNWVLTFADEFAGRDLDFAKWAPHSGAGKAPQVVPGAVEVSDGHARITARREDGKFTSGVISSYGTFGQMYGRFEVRLKAPQGRGFESRVRLMPVPSGTVPAIDVVRILGTAPDRALFGNLWGDEKTERSFSGSWNLNAAGDGFHVIAVEWDASKIVWYLDGKERFRSVDGVPHQPMYVEIDLNVAGGEAKYPDSTTPFPSSLEIDYVRAWKPAGL